jgi:hypothetical protein
MASIARIVSWIFQPLLMPLAGTLIFLNLPFYAFRLLPTPVYSYVLVSTVLFTIVLPVLAILLLYRFRMISAVEMPTAEDRRFPLLLTIIFYMGNYYFLAKASLPILYSMFLLSGIVSLIVALVVNRFWKLSLHMTGLGGLAGSLLLCAIFWPVDIRLLLAAVFVVTGITASSRLVLGAHSGSQLALGYFVGIVPQLMVLSVYLL